MTTDLKKANEETRDVWDHNATVWDTRMAEGNSFHNVLVWPATERLLRLQPGERVLDAACGNGLSSRRMAAAGAEVVAFDFAGGMIAHARRRTVENADRIRYLVLDATDEAALLELGKGSFDAAVCNMALFDMAEIDPLLRAVAQLLRPGGRFVFSVLHPCFNSGTIAQCAEQRDVEGDVRIEYSIRISGYMTPTVLHGLAMLGQPKPQLLFHRPLHVLLGSAFRAGFVVDGLEEAAFPPEQSAGSTPLSWGGQYSEIPPVMVVRVRRPG
jgi:2-polyprenyl-3-methyl-5-hydroxy-6-metoxy-1,4-benzoquinol methylase